MFHQLLTPVADSLPLSFIVAALPVLTVLVLLGVLRRPAWQSSLAGLVGRADHRDRGLEPSGLSRPQFDRKRRRVRALAGHVDRRQRAAPLQYRGGVEAVRRVPGMGPQPPAERPPRGARRDRLLLRRAPGRHRRLWHARRDHLVAAHSGGLSRSRSARVRSDLQYRAGRLRRARRAGDGAGRGDWTARSRPWRDGRPPAAVRRPDPAVLRDGALRRRPLAAGAVARAAGRRRLLRAVPVCHVELHQLRIDGRSLVARLADRDAPVPAGLEARRPMRNSP